MKFPDVIPDDVLTLIYDFSRPRMRFVEQYNTAIRALKMPKWKQVQEKLMLKDVADKVIKALSEYAVATVDLRRMQEKEKVIQHGKS
jgi:hypothetical protein